MKTPNGETIRVGFGLGTNSATNTPGRLSDLVDGLEQLGFDSLWVAERVAGSSLDPLVAMTWAAARTEKLKFGPSVMVLPGRNPVLLANALASLDHVSGGRLLPAFGLGAVNLAEHQAFGVERGERSSWFDEALPLLRRLWSVERVDHNGDRFQLEGVRIRPRPVQHPLEVWLGGRAPSELRRTARLGDGWLASFCTPDDVADGIAAINAHSDEIGRAPIDPGHFGAMITYVDGPSIPNEVKARIEKVRPGVDAASIVVAGVETLTTRITEFADAGASKFVLTPLDEPDSWSAPLENLAQSVLHLHT